MSFLHDLPIAELISQYGYIAIFVIITLESAGLPLPGETVLLTSAAYAGSTGQLNIGLVVAIAATAAILGDNAGYWVGRRWGLPLLLRKGHLIGLDHGRLKLGQYLFRQHGGKIVFFGRFTAMLRAFAAVLAGVNKLDARQFFAFNALGGLAWASIMGFGAYLCGRSIENVMGPVGLGLLALVILGAVGLWLFMRRHEARLMAAAEEAIPGPLVEALGEDPRPAASVPDRDAAGPAASLRDADAERAPPAPIPAWFKLPVILLLATVGMTLVSWQDGVTGGLYGRLAGSIGSTAVLLTLLVPAGVLFLIRSRLKNARPSVAPEARDTGRLIRPAS